jgi:3-isopropylmalate/(R)-2-methylmalate dehydratase small subunit
MRAFERVTGTAVPLRWADIDTDAIIPQQWLITTQRAGLGRGLFANWRYLAGGLEPDPAFALNEPRFQDARILVAGPNYGCGSSREHAVWAHLDYGIEAIVAARFGAIFYDNALKNGLAVVTLAEDFVAAILLQLETRGSNTMSVDLTSNQITAPDGRTHTFTMDASRRQALLDGRDEISETLNLSAKIDAFQEADRLARPWIWDITVP